MINDALLPHQYPGQYFTAVLRRGRIIAGFSLLLLVVVLSWFGSASAQIVVYDDAGYYFKTANWTNGSTGGFGYVPWVMNTSGAGSHGWYLNNGYAIASATNVLGTSYTNCSWGIYANGTGGNKTVVTRGFGGGNSLTTNVTFMLQWMSEGIGSATTNMGGFVLRNGNATNGVTDYTNGARFQYYYAGGGADSYLIIDGTGVRQIGIPFGAGYGNAANSHANATGMNCEFSLEGPDRYRFVVKSATNGNILGVLDNQPLAGTAGSTIDSAAMFAFQTTGSGTSGGDQNFNRMQIVSNTAVPPSIVNVQPANGATHIDPATKLFSFEVDAPFSTVSGTNVTLTLNGVPQTNLLFNTSSATQQLLVTNSALLSSNVLYSAMITVTDANGNTATNTISFDTLLTNTWLDVFTNGATGNGTTKDTAAIQATINACPPGGFVWLHDGTFLSGTITLKDNMTLYIDKTATLFGSGSAADYPTQSPPTSNGQLSNCARALIYAQQHTNVTIMGGGTINGNGRTNFTSGVENTRPISIWTVLCNGVTIQNLNIVDSAMWTVVNMETDNLLIQNLNESVNLPGNRDGCDVVDCWHVTIRNCTINSGDDSICIKSGKASRGVNDCHVSNCTVTASSSNGLKFGTASTGPFTNVTFQNCLVQNTAHSAMAVESVDGAAVSGIVFSNITFTGCQNAIFIVLGSRSGATVGSVNGIEFHNITGSAMSDTRGCPISGELTNGVTYYVRNILFDNVNISYAGGVGSIPAAPPEYAGQYPENTMWGNLPAYGYYIRHAIGVTFTNCYTSAASTDARPWIATNDVSGLTVIGPTLNMLQTQPLILQWSNAFVLQTATNLTGPYSDLSGATSPYTTNTSAATPQRVYRLRQ